MRKIERNFKDFRLFNLQTQVKEIHSDLYLAQRRKDRVTMQRSLSDQLYSQLGSLPQLLAKIDQVNHLQARTFMTPDENEWAQLTCRLVGKDQDGFLEQRMCVIERRFSDQVSFVDWRMCFYGPNY